VKRKFTYAFLLRELRGHFDIIRHLQWLRECLYLHVLSTCTCVKDLFIETHDLFKILLLREILNIK